MRPPLLLIGHGTHDDTGVAEFGRFVHRLRCRLDRDVADVSGGFVTGARPPLGESVASLVARGHHHLVAQPLSLTGDRAALGDIPGTLALAQELHPTLGYDLGRPLGPDPRILELLAERLADAADDMPTFVRGAFFEDAEPITPAGDGGRPGRPRLAQHLGERRGPPGVAAVLGDPRGRLPDGRDGLRARTRAPGSPAAWSAAGGWAPSGSSCCPTCCSRVACWSASGPQALAYGANHEGLDIRCAEVIGDCEGLADVVIDRYEEALAGAAATTARQRYAQALATERLQEIFPVPARV